MTTINIKYLASLAEKLNKSSDIMILKSKETTVLEAWQQLNPNTPIPANTICAINFQYVALGAYLKENDELAFFPPVTGG